MFICFVCAPHLFSFDFLFTFRLIDLYLGSTIPQLFSTPTALEFARDYVGKNLPLVIRGGVSDWPACTKWNSKYFRIMSDKLVAVAVTPNGYADGIAMKKPENREYFVMPDEQTMSMGDFLDRLDDRKSEHICYIQKQNSNLENDFMELHEDIDMTTLQFACDAFNKKPDAKNLWMGDQRAITSSMPKFLLISFKKNYIRFFLVFD